MLPLFVLGILPCCLLFFSNDTTIGREVPLWLNILALSLGLFLILSGTALMVLTIRMFYKIGNGTLAPWAPTQHLVVQGIYQRTRNPMISGVILFALREGVLLSSWYILVYAALIFVLNHVYFIFSEEPGLQKRFGEEYSRYKANVPRWFPRKTPWIPVQDSEE